MAVPSKIVVFRGAGKAGWYGGVRALQLGQLWPWAHLVPLSLRHRDPTKCWWHWGSLLPGSGGTARKACGSGTPWTPSRSLPALAQGPRGRGSEGTTSRREAVGDDAALAPGRTAQPLRRSISHPPHARSPGAAASPPVTDVHWPPSHFSPLLMLEMSDRTRAAAGVCFKHTRWIFILATISCSDRATAPLIRQPRCCRVCFC